MEHCKYREVDLCKVLAEGGNLSSGRPVCSYPSLSTETCPIARVKDTKITLREAFDQMNNLGQAQSGDVGGE